MSAAWLVVDRAVEELELALQASFENSLWASASLEDCCISLDMPITCACHGSTYNHMS